VADSTPISKSDRGAELVEVITGKSSVFVPCLELFAGCDASRRVLLDLGAGDGSFAYRYAKAHSDALVIGVDPARDRLAVNAIRARRKPARGGVSNVRFVAAGLETLPDCFEGVFDTVFVIYPWASLLRTVVIAEPGAMLRLAGLLKIGGVLEVVLNMQVIEDEKQRVKLDLPLLDEQYMDEALGPGMREVGLVLVEYLYLLPDQSRIASTWGGKLARGSKRNSLWLQFVRSRDEASGQVPEIRFMDPF
jgi:16S rRNA (adenine(1408)-N(1))-methyltransferase